MDVLFREVVLESCLGVLIDPQGSMSHMVLF